MQILFTTLTCGYRLAHKMVFFAQVNLRYFVSDLLCHLFDIANRRLGCIYPGVHVFAGSLESAYSLIWGSHKIWGKGGGDTLDLL